MYNTHDPKVLPVRDGVRPSCVVLPSQGNGLVLDYLCVRLPFVGRNEWLWRMSAGEVVDEYGRKVVADSKFVPGVRIYYYRQLNVEKSVPFEEAVIFQDEHLVVADKPHFMPVNPAGQYLQNSLLVRLRNRLGIEELSPLHRIDRDTAGLVAFSVKRSERGRYQALFAQKQVVKTYEAYGLFNENSVLPLRYESRLDAVPQSIRMQEVDGDSNAITEVALLEVLGDIAKYRITPVTGKRHQIRVHMAALGMPLCNDLLYPVNAGGEVLDYQNPLQLLAKQLSFKDPITGGVRYFESSRSLMPLEQLAKNRALLHKYS